jgi:ATP-dependent protease ClpP protease subunit
LKTPPRVQRYQPPERSGESRHGWEIAISGDLTDKQTELVEKLVELPPRSRGTIYFDSCGGSAYVGLSLGILIRLRGLDATGIVLGECSSAALVPFAACRRRFVTPISYLFFHPVRWSSDENVRIEEAAEWTRHFSVLEVDMDRYLAQAFGVPLEQLVAWTRPGRFFSGTELAETGIAKMIDLTAGDLYEQLRRLA